MTTVSRFHLAFAAHFSACLQLLVRQKNPDTLFFNREPETTGDTKLGMIARNMLDGVEWPSITRSPLPTRWLTGRKPGPLPDATFRQGLRARSFNAGKSAGARGCTAAWSAPRSAGRRGSPR